VPPHVPGVPSGGVGAVPRGVGVPSGGVGAVPRGVGVPSGGVGAVPMPSRRVGAILAALMLVAGIAAGIAIGPGSAASFAASARGAALARVLALLAVDSGTGGSSGALLATTAIHPSATTPPPTPTPSAPSTSTNAVGGISKTDHGASSAGGGSSSTSSSSTGSQSPAPAASPTKGGGSGEKTTTPLPPIAQVWVIALPYGESLANAVGQPTAAPYLDGQLVKEGTQLTAYTSLAAGQLAGAAALISGQVTAGVTTISPPPCGSAATGQDATGAAGATGAQGSGGTQGATGAQGTTAPCPSGEPAGVQAADGFLRQAVGQITATAAYREHGLIAITFVPAGQEGAASTGSSTSPTAGSPATSSPGAISYPGGTIAATLTVAGQPAGALLLSPFLRHAGARIATTFNQLSPRESLEGLLKVHPG
jgi:hypothetical protein